jgi:hypothetical protein
MLKFLMLGAGSTARWRVHMYRSLGSFARSPSSDEISRRRNAVASYRIV